MDLARTRRPGCAKPCYRRPYEGTDVDLAATQASLEWESGLMSQPGRDGAHGFKILTKPFG